MEITYSELDKECQEKIEKYFVVVGPMEVNPGKYIVPQKFQELGKKILGMEVRPDDVWLISYPRTGSTWTRQMTWCLMNGLDYEAAKLWNLKEAPALEYVKVYTQTGVYSEIRSIDDKKISRLVDYTAIQKWYFGDDESEWLKTTGYLVNNSVDYVEQMSSPRFIRTHLPWELLPSKINIIKPKIIYTARNPKDCCISWYYCCMLLFHAYGPLEDFCKLFLQGKVPFGSMWEHAKQFWKHRNEYNILFLKYEDTKKNHLGCIKMISKFLGKNYSDEELQGLVDHTSFSKMRANPTVNMEYIDTEEVKFIRKGQVGDWQNHMSKEMADQFDEMSKIMWSDIGLTFEDRI